MRILVFSDSHGDKQSMQMAFEKEKNIQAAIFLGDGLADFEEFCAQHKNIKTYAVCGNNDFSINKNYPNTLNIKLLHHTIIITHGHMYGVKTGRSKLALKAKESGADIALYGHTHNALQEDIADVTLINPGSISRYGFNPSYAVVEINGDVKVNFHTLGE